jgi:hypothetical protein
MQSKYTHHMPESCVFWGTWRAGEAVWCESYTYMGTEAAQCHLENKTGFVFLSMFLSRSIHTLYHISLPPHHPA